MNESTLKDADEQNQKFIGALAELERKQEHLDRMIKELEQKNQSLTTLNREVNALNSELENRVRRRTEALQKVNIELTKARDEAIKAGDLRTQFVANLSHEIRTPLCGILGLSEIISSTDVHPDEAKEMCQTILISGKQLLIVVNQILDFSKLQAHKMQLQEEEFRISDVIAEARSKISFEASSKEIEFMVESDRSLETVLYGDKEKLGQIVFNLLHNALKFTEKGTIRIVSRIYKQALGKVFVKLEIHDEGIGIADASREKLFQSFVQVDGSNTRKYGGTGIGLWLSKGMTELMGGAIGCESELGSGSQFWVVIPFSTV